MSISSTCLFCKKSAISHSSREDHIFTVTYECGSYSTYEQEPNSSISVTQNYNKCTFIPPPGVPENPDDWTDFYKNETYETSAYEAHLAMMGERFQWLHELGDLYKTLIENLSEREPLEQDILLLVQTCVTARTELITAFRALAKGYSTDCRLKSRLVVEYSIFAARAVEKPGSAKLWLEAGNSERDWKRYRENFKIHYLLEKEDAWRVLVDLKPQLERLASHYAHLSQFTHATVLASGLRTEGFRVTFNASFVERFIEHRFLGIFAELVDVHLDVINLMIKLANFLKINVDERIFEMVKLLEVDVNNLLEQVNSSLGASVSEIS